MATRVRLKRYRSIIIILSIFRCCVFLSFSFLCYPVSRTSGSDSFSLCARARARVHTHITHTHARADARERAHTHMHTHANTHRHHHLPLFHLIFFIFPRLHVQTICVITTSQIRFSFSSFLFIKSVII